MSVLCLHDVMCFFFFFNNVSAIRLIRTWLSLIILPFFICLYENYLNELFYHKQQFTFFFNRTHGYYSKFKGQYIDRHFYWCKYLVQVELHIVHIIAVSCMLEEFIICLLLGNNTYFKHTYTHTNYIYSS